MTHDQPAGAAAQGETPGPAEALLAAAAGPAGTLALAVEEQWLQGRTLYGGVQLALAMRAARQVLADPAPIRSIHATFVAPVAAGAPVEARASCLRRGRSVTHVRAMLWQGDRQCLESTALFGAGRDSGLAHDSDQPEVLDADAAYAVPQLPGVTPAFLRYYDLRFVRGAPPFSGAADPRATILARPKVAAGFTETEFLALTDVIPPAVLCKMKGPGPASSMNCALELIRPERVYGTRQWIRFEVALHDTHSGYAWQTARLYDESGRLLALSHQSVAVFG